MSEEALPKGHVRSIVESNGIPADATVVTDADKVEVDGPGSTTNSVVTKQKGSGDTMEKNELN